MRRCLTLPPALIFFPSRTHSDLSTLVRFHQSIAVSKTGTRLTNPVGAKTGNRSIIKLVGN